MKSKKTVFLHSNNKNARVLIQALLVGFFALDRQAQAQYILAPGPPPPDQTPPAMQQTNEMGVFATHAPNRVGAAQVGTGDLAAASLLPVSVRRWNPAQHQPGSPFHHSDKSHRGPSWRSAGIGPLDYSPLWTVYSNNKF